MAPHGVLAWDASSVSVGTLRGTEPTLRPISTEWRDIRSCRPAPDGSWLLVSGGHAGSGAYGLWRVDTVDGASGALLRVDHVGHGAIDPTGSRVAYTAPPSLSRSDTSLHLLDLADSSSRELVEGSVAASCVPSWRTPDRVLFHTEEREVVELDVVSGRPRRLFPGEHPAASPDGDRVAYRVGSTVLVAADGTPEDVSPRRRGLLARPYRGGMTWSPDGGLLLLARTGGTLGYETRVGTLDVRTRTFTEVLARHLHGIAFLGRAARIG